MTSEAPSSTLLSDLDPKLYSMLQSTENTSAFNSHSSGITPDDFARSQALSETFVVLSTSYDLNGVEFVSVIEGIDLPFFAVQWHPEKNVFELGKTTDGRPYEAIVHSPEAIAVTQYLANFFVSAARKNEHKFSDPADEAAAIIWNYPVSTTLAPEFEQSYLF